MIKRNGPLGSLVANAFSWETRVIEAYRRKGRSSGGLAALARLGGAHFFWPRRERDDLNETTYSRLFTGADMRTWTSNRRTG